MTSEDVRAELEKEPFIPLRFHLVSGKTVDVVTADAGWMLQNALFVFHKAPRGADAGYDVISLRNIERIEQVIGENDTGPVE